MLSLEIGGTKYSLGNPRSCSREIRTDSLSMSQAFGLPQLAVETVELGEFVGDVEQGGSCNVRTLSFTPHNLTHVETPAHIISDGKTLLDIPSSVFQGLAVMVDLTSTDLPDNYIYPHHLEILTEYQEGTILIVKTIYSEMKQDMDFTGTDPISLHPSTTQFLTDHHSSIQLLMLDLPSADKEDDGGKLQAHRNFFGIAQTDRGLSKAIVELGYYSTLQKPGYYFVMISPARIDVDAIITDLMIYDILE